MLEEPSRIRRSLALLGLLPLILLVITLIYMLGMNGLEDRPRDFWQSLAWASETLTTTGYGHDSQWQHPLMITFVVLVQFAGVFLVFLVVPIFLIPFLERRFEQKLPRTLPPRFDDYVLIFRYGPAVTSLMEDMQHEHIPAAVIEPDESLARRLRERGHRLIALQMEDQDLLRAAIARARALVLNGSDDDNAALILNARQSGFALPIYALVQNPLHRQPMMLTGATAVYSPKHALAAALAAKASHHISPRVAGLQQLGEHLEVAEMRIAPTSPVAEVTLAGAGIRERTGATVVGIWNRGQLETNMRPESVLHAGAIAVAIGSGESLARLGRLATPLTRTGPVFVAGYGEVGSKVIEMLKDVGEQTLVIDRLEIEGVDLVADALDVNALRSLGIEQARAVILALSSDSANLFAATIVRDMAPEMPIIARVNRAEDVARIRAAGADFALSVGQVAGQLLGAKLFGEQFVALEPRMRVAKVSAHGVAGLTPTRTHIRERTGCSLVAVERGDEIFVELDSNFELDEDDTLYLCGSGEAVARYFELHPADRHTTATSASAAS